MENNYLEDFRQKAIEAEKADECIIDCDSYAGIAFIPGCFFDGKNWIVYNTDERSKPFNISKFSHPLFAYKELGKRIGFKYSPNKYLQFKASHLNKTDITYRYNRIYFNQLSQKKLFDEMMESIKSDKNKNEYIILKATFYLENKKDNNKEVSVYIPKYKEYSIGKTNDSSIKLRRNLRKTLFRISQQEKSYKKDGVITDSHLRPVLCFNNHDTE